MPARVRVHLVVRGRVQGVSFRAYTAQEARGLGVSGWVRNLPDGSVEVEAEGEQGAVEALVAWCRHGPPIARVEGVELEWRGYQGELGEFAIEG